MAMATEARVRLSDDPDSALIAGNPSYDAITEEVSSIVLKRFPPKAWFFFAFTFAWLLILLYSISYLIAAGIGVWGVNIPVAWGFAITNFVWWIGIGHAGTLISAILLIMRQHWRNSINRFAEAMTLFAVMCAGMFPLLHLGRPWVFYWLLPYPDTMGLWPQWRSALVWDAFAVTTYFLVSLIFWYIGLLPDLASMRDRATRVAVRKFYGVLALGWLGSAQQYQRFEMVYLLLGALATPLVVSVHSVVSMDFAIAQLPGWHSTIFPPYFVAGAIYSGFAMVFSLVIPVRALFKLHNVITQRHLDYMAYTMLVSGLLVSYGYVMEGFDTWVSGSIFDQYMMMNRLFGPYRVATWTTLICNVVLPQAAWFRVIRRSTPWLFVISIIVNIGMWMERYVIVVTSLHRDFMPSAWGNYHPTFWDWTVFLGSIGFFLSAMFLFIRLIPAVPMSEVRELLDETSKPAPAGGGE